MKWMASWKEELITNLHTREPDQHNGARIQRILFTTDCFFLLVPIQTPRVFSYQQMGRIFMLLIKDTSTFIGLV